MTMIKFYKYQGTGNDFIMIDNRSLNFDKRNKKLMQKMCDRRFGIGADGLILLENDDEVDFKMIYFNADGSESTMCGNGGRCIVMFAKKMGVFSGNRCTFVAIDGPHDAEIEGDQVKLKMINVTDIKLHADDYIIDTGSPHFVRVVDNLAAIDVYAEGKKIRYGHPFNEQGINVNFVHSFSDHIEVATYERGVEDETFSCGTGVTAAALAMHRYDDQGFSSPQHIITKGGRLKVHYTLKDEVFYDVYLEGPAVMVYEGEWE